MQVMFGSGVAWATPLADAAGVAIANPTPVIFAKMQDISVDFSFATKMLYGQFQFPIAVGRGTGKIEGKSKFASVNGATLNNLFFGQTLASGIYTDYFDTTGAAIPGTPFAITPTVPSSGTWAADLGVMTAGGVPYIRVASAPATGQYSVAAGVYTFAAADTTLVVYISYRYTATSTVAKKIALNNQTLGYQPSFLLDLILPYNNKVLTLTLNACVSEKLGFTTKLDDFVIPEFDFQAFADNNNAIGTISTSE